MRPQHLSAFRLLRTRQVIFGLFIASPQMAPAQVDPSGDVLQLAYHRPLTRQAIQAVSNNRSLIDHEYLRTNSVLLLTSAPVWLGDKSSGGQLPSSIIGLTTAMTVSASGE